MRQDNISKNNFEQCLKCDLCTTVCPMMEVNPNYPGPKQAGPDGERYRLKDPAFYDLTLKYCLNCKRCEVACPSGVEVGDIIQAARIRYGRQSHPLRDSLLGSTDFFGTVVAPLADCANRALKRPMVKSVLDAFGIDRRRQLPEYSPVRFTEWYDAQSQKAFDRYVSFYHGCYVNYNYPKLGKDLVCLLNACGYGVRLLDREKCCGVPLITNGMTSKARRNAKTNLKAIRKALADGSEAVLATSSTCTFTIRDEYENLLDQPSGDIRQSMMLATKWLFSKVEDGSIRLAFKEDWKGNMAYHVACHMQKLGWTLYSVGLLKMIPGLKLTVLEQECCGIAGTFGFKKENYDFSKKIGEKLFRKIADSGADSVVTECETCKWQIESNTAHKVFNPIEVILEALDIEKTKELNRQ